MNVRDSGHTLPSPQWGSSVIDMYDKDSLGGGINGKTTVRRDITRKTGEFETLMPIAT